MGVAAVLNGFVPRKLGEISTAPPHSLGLSLLPEYQLGQFQLERGQAAGSHGALGSYSRGILVTDFFVVSQG